MSKKKPTARRTRSAKPKQTGSYRHPEATALLRPEIGAQAQFKKKKPPATYRYDASLAPQLNWDGQNPARELGSGCSRRLKRPRASRPPMSYPRRLAAGHELAAALRVARRPGQMIYMDPPYGLRFGSNSQPFVRKRDVKHNDDEHMTRVPEMVTAYRDTWELGLHHLYVIGFAIQPNARRLIEDCDAVIGVAATYVQATPDLMMGDLLKSLRSSRIFSVCGLPEVRLFESKQKGADGRYQVELLGLDVFDPATMDTDHRAGDDVLMWMLDTDYNGMVFHVRQAFFPRTPAWDALERTLKADFEDTVWEHLSGTVSAPFEPGEHGRIAVKVIDDRGNELLVEKAIEDGES